MDSKNVTPAAGALSLSDATPLDPGTAAAGDETAAARGNHVHNPCTVAQVGAAAARTTGAHVALPLGTATTLAAIAVNDDVLTKIEWEFVVTRDSDGLVCHRNYELLATATGGTATIIGTNAAGAAHNGFSVSSVAPDTSGANVNLKVTGSGSGGCMGYARYRVTELPLPAP